MVRKVLLVGYGSIGKRHARNLLELGITPYILTKFPDKLNAVFLRNINEAKGENIESCIISSPTARHLDDLMKCVTVSRRLKEILIEKPLESSYLKGKKIKNVALKYRLKISVAYNLRFIDTFAIINKFIQKQKNRIKIVEVIVGYDLREWRPSYRDVRQSHSAHRKLGGGVDLELSHEIDYILWLFGKKIKHKLMYRARISDLTVDSPDIFKLFLDYGKFVVDMTLDYIRKPKERYIKIICDDGHNLYYDFFNSTLNMDGKTITRGNNIDDSYKRMLRFFLGIDKMQKIRLCTINEGIDILKLLEV